MTAIVAKAPKDHAALECLGRVYFAMNRYRDAADQFEKAIRIDDNVASHHLWLGNALGNTADSTSKIKLPFLARRVKSEFERTVALDPQSLDGRAGLVDFYSQAPSVMGGSMDKAHEQAREILKLNPMRGHLEEADLYGREKKPAEVERELKAAEQAAPDSAVAMYTLGSFYQNSKRWADAFGVYDRMLKRFPGELLVHFQIGRAAALSGEQLERGERELKTVLSTAPADFPRPTLAGAHHRLGMIYEKQGRKDAARAEYQVAVSINPKNEDAKKSLAALK
jgi:tetratricopeptide (TPR) repeat protein